MADYSEDQLFAKLERADAAGDAEAASVIADEIRRLRSQAGPKADFSDVQAQMATTERPGAARHTGQYGITPHLLDFADAAGHHSMNALHGGAQALQHGTAAVVNALPFPDSWKSAVNDTVAADDAALRQREADYQARTQTSPSSVLGAGIGEVAPWLTGTVALRARGALPTISAQGGRVANLARKGGLLAAEGGLMGLTTPVTEGGDYGDQKTSQIVTGAAAAPLLAGGLSAAGMGANAIGRSSRYLTNSGREKIANEQVAKLLGAENLPALRAPGAVDGFTPTPAQVIGTPEAVQAERVLRNDARSAPFFAQQESANNAALRAQVAKLAGDDQAMQAARLARAQATDPYYERLGSAKADPTPVLAALDRLEGSGLGVNKNVKSAVANIRSEVKSRLDSEGKMPADALSGLYSEYGSYLEPMASAKEKKALGTLRDSIADALDAAVPGYRDNVAAFARLSQPISDMQAGRAVLDAIDSATRDAGGNQAVSLTKINAALSKDKRAAFPMSPQARKQLEAVRDALQQRSISNNTVAASGPGTAADLMRGGGVPDWMIRAGGAALGGAGSIFGGIPAYAAGQMAGEGAIAARNSVARKIGQKASSASSAADAIEAYKRAQAERGLLAPYLQQSMLPYITE